MVAGRNIKNIGKPNFRWLMLSALLLLASSIPATPEEDTARCLKLGADDGVAEFHPLFENILASIYQRAGHCAVSFSLAPKRVEMMIANGALDGDWMRAAGFAEQSHVSLIEVPVPLFQLEAVLLARAESNFNGTPEDLKGRTVGYPAGFYWIEKSLLALGAIPREVPVGVPVEELLKRGRFEVFATDGVWAYPIMRSQNKGEKTIRQTSWAKIPFFHLVHARHADKVDGLAREIENAINTGEFDHLFALPGLERVEQVSD
jgi:hypothetical protein